MALAAIIDVEGTKLTADERAMFAATDPWAFILFARSCQNHDQLKALTAEIRDSVGRDCLIFIDQEGGRVQRLKPPVWAAFPPIALYGKIYQYDKPRALDAVWLHHRMMAQQMHEVGINGDCSPCIDLLVSGAHSVIGDRSFGADPAMITDLAESAIMGLHAGGVASVIKHFPGHGRAHADSHFALPVIDEGKDVLAADLAPYRALAAKKNKDGSIFAPMGMSAHVVMKAYDSAQPATLSKKMMVDLLRKDVAYDGLVMTDDISMKALNGTHAQKAVAAFEAGCDVVMLCNQSLEERLAFLSACPTLSGDSLRRAHVADGFGQARPVEIHVDWAFRRLAELIKPEREMIEKGFDPTEVHEKTILAAREEEAMKQAEHLSKREFH